MRKFILPLLFVPAIAFAFDFVTTDLIADNAITNAKIADNAITDDLISDNSITPIKLASDNAPTDEYCFTYEGDTGNGQWQICGGGGATPPFTDNDLAPGSVNSVQVADNSLTGTDLQIPLTLSGDNISPILTVTNSNPLSASPAFRVGSQFELNRDGNLELSFGSNWVLEDGSNNIVIFQASGIEFGQDDLEFRFNGGQRSITGSSATDMIRAYANSGGVEWQLDGLNDRFYILGGSLNLDDNKGIYFDTDIDGNTEIHYDSGITALQTNIDGTTVENATSTNLDLLYTTVTLPASSQFYFEGVGSDTYVLYDSGNTDFEIFVDGTQTFATRAGLTWIQSTQTVLNADNQLVLDGVIGDTFLKYDSGTPKLQIDVDGSTYINLDANIGTVNLETQTIVNGKLNVIGNNASIDANSQFYFEGDSSDTYMIYDNGPSIFNFVVDAGSVFNATSTQFAIEAAAKFSSSTSYSYQDSAAGSENIDASKSIVLKTGITGGGDTLTLPDPTNLDGYVVTIKDASFSAGTDNITIAPFGAENIDGVAASISISVDGGKVTLITNGVDWFSI